jgi:hypothetical protein
MMRRDDLGPPEDMDIEAPSTLEAALRVPDFEDGDTVRSLWDGLAAEAAVVEDPVDSTDAPGPETDALLAPPVTGSPAAPGPEPAPVEDDLDDHAPLADAPLTRRQARLRKRELKHQTKVKKLERRRHRILPRTAIGIATMLLFFGLGVGLAGAVLYAYYDWRLSENEQRVGELSESLERRLLEANEELNISADNSIQLIRQEAAPLRDLLEQERVVGNLTGRMDGSVWFVETLDENGAPSVGSAFVAASDDAQSLLVTSFGAVAAGTTEPAPTITVRSGEESFEAELHTWDPEHDLALLILPRGGLDPLPWADDDALAHIVGERIWAVEGIGGNGVSLSPGSVIDQSAVGIQHTAALNAAFRGGPVVNGRGEVVAIASIGYAPLNYATGDVTFGVPVQAACEQILECSGDVPGTGAAPSD